MEAISNLPVNLFDIGVIAVLLISSLFAYARGFVHEVFAVIGWIGAILATFYGFPYLILYSRQLIPMPLAADIATGALIFICTLVLLSIITKTSPCCASEIKVLIPSLKTAPTFILIL